MEEEKEIEYRNPSDRREIEKLKLSVDQHAKDMKELKEKLEPVIEVWASLSGFVKVLRWMAIAAKWLIFFATLIAFVATFGKIKIIGL